MKNVTFKSASLEEKRSKLARVLKAKTDLSDEEIIQAVTKIDVSKQYSIKKVNIDTFTNVKDNEKIINQTGNWEEKIQTKVSILIQTNSGGIAIVEKTHIGCLDLSKSEKSYSILVY